MATSLGSQLRALKSIIPADSEQPSKKGPITRPSILLDPKEAADTDIDSIYNKALEGLNELIKKDVRFRSYEDDLFSEASKEFDRKKKNKGENSDIDSRISSYLRLLSAYFQHYPHSLKTLDYLIRRYDIHVDNIEEMILCALPYHDTHEFVYIIQQIDTGNERWKNSRWRFLEAVKATGAVPPRKVIVQQCLRDRGVLEVLCNYASYSKKLKPSRQVVGFCTAVVVEALGSATPVTDDLVKKIIPFVSSGLHAGAKAGSDHRAGALMIVGLLSSKATLSPKLVKTWIQTIAEIAQEDAEKSTGLQWFRLSIITLISLVQSQSVDVLPKKALEILMEIRDFTEILLKLFKEFNIEKLFSVLLDSLVYHSFSNESSKLALISILEKAPVKDLSLHKPKADFQCATLSDLSMFDLLKAKDTDPQALDNVLKRCLHLLRSSLENTSSVYDAALSCLKSADSIFCGQMDRQGEIASMILPLLLVARKTRRLNLEVLKLAKKTNWGLFNNLESVSCTDTELKNESERRRINKEIITNLAEGFSVDPEKHIVWIVKSCNAFELSNRLFFLVLSLTYLLQDKSAKSFPLLEASESAKSSPLLESSESAKFFPLLEACFPVLKTEWEAFLSLGDILVNELETKIETWDWRKSPDQLCSSSFKVLYANILICIFWRLWKAFISVVMPAEVSVQDEYKTWVSRHDNEKWVSRLIELFKFLSVCQSKHVFEDQKNFPHHFLSSLFTEEDVPVAVQVESLHCYTYLCSPFLCSRSEDGLSIQLLDEFPSVLVPLASCNQDIRSAAMNCMEKLQSLCSHVDYRRKKDGNHIIWSIFLDGLLDSIVDQKGLILSDGKFLPSFMVSLLSSSHSSLLVPKNIKQRFDQPTRGKILDFILSSALKRCDYAKQKILSLLKGLGNAIIRVKDVDSLLRDLLGRRYQISSHLSKIEVEILCLLLESCAMPSSTDRCECEGYLLMALQLDDMVLEHPAVVQPCVTVLEKLNGQVYSGLDSKMQELLFRQLVFLFRSANADIQNATREALLRLDVASSTIVNLLNEIIEGGSQVAASASGKKKNKFSEKQKLNPLVCGGENSLKSLLDVLLLKKDIANRDLLLGPLYKLLKLSSDVRHTMSGWICDMQQTLLIILNDISASLTNCLPLKEDKINEIEIQVLVECARSANDGVTRNHILSLISTVAKIIPDKVLDHINNLLPVIGEAAATQFDNHSRHVFEDLISTVVPCWLQRTQDKDMFLQTFMNYMPDIAEHRRLSIILYLLRILGETESLAALLFHLFRSLVSRKKSSCFDNKLAADSSITSMKTEWEYAFAVRLCEQYSCTIWLPCLVMVLHRIEMECISLEALMELLFAIQFMLQKLQDPEFAFKLESGKDSENIQNTLKDLMEQVVCILQFADAKMKQTGIPVFVKKYLKDGMHAVLRTISVVIIPSAYFEGISKLLDHADKRLAKKALGLLCETVREHNTSKRSHKERRDTNSQWQLVDENAVISFHRMCRKIVQLVDSADASSNLKLVSVMALDVLANRFPSDQSIFSECLATVTKNISSHNVAVSSGCLRATAALVNVLGPRSLPQLPSIMEKVFLCSDVKSIQSIDKAHVSSSTKNESIFSSALVVLEVVVDKLGGFLNPYLGNIIEFLLHPHFASESDLKLKLKADSVRRLIAERIPVRLALQPLQKIYSKVAISGDSSLRVYFGMLANLISSMDRSSVAGYHVQIYESCLHALDLRREHHILVQNVDAVEKSVINAIISLTMKLTETMFKPLFVRSIEWAAEDIACEGSTNIDRAISFYALVDKLAENHRSLFVPYFKNLLESSVHHLTVAGDKMTSGSTRKKKKAKILETNNKTEENSLSLGTWHLRALILSSLHKCFLYDTGSLKFLDTSNFQILLKPIVSQLVIEPPISVEEHFNIPSVKEVDDLLVVCIGQMAVTAGSDLLWKPLNHEVLMQTRSEKIRARILGLRIVKYLLEHLREEYLVFLPETIPFLGELLEDAELSVKSLAQEILKEMESISGESLQQYL
ncbi:uncharacterized protein At3g06530 isoform X1 [Ziziphus jujuba]|uniref:Uncharacterized protein At3g06530 isoform X1 n=1 Tax=Ziziphus jujuba TaxID=326968 RepID=A0A6P3ZGR5_ZIZJJ|nr:uncharacterized protein At3g06530 isoform X1 [Ziziphus jujuba]